MTRNKVIQKPRPKNILQDFTGKKAVHIESGKTYEEIKGEAEEL
jgi:hypothetical protein